MARRAVTKAQAEAVLAEVRRVFAAYLDGDASGPFLQADFDFVGNGPAPWAVVWEGGPYDWAILATAGGVDEGLSAEGYGIFHTEAIRQPAGVFCEPYTSWALGIYPA